MSVPEFELSTGARMPCVGLGTWLIDAANAETLVAEALRAGYRHIDTAQAYGKDSGVGKGVRAGREEWGIGRSSVFFTTKIAAEAKDYDSALASIDQSRDKLGLDYIDLMIIHSPQPWVEFRGTDKRYFAENLQVWRALEDAQAAGKVKAIGVSNFLEDDLANILENAHTQPAVNQVLAHISNMPTELIDYCHRNGVVVEAYSPLGHGANFRNRHLMSIASTYGVGVAQLWLRYLLDKWLVVFAQDHQRRTIANKPRARFCAVRRRRLGSR